MVDRREGFGSLGGMREAAKRADRNLRYLPVGVQEHGDQQGAGEEEIDDAGHDGWCARVLWANRKRKYAEGRGEGGEE